MIEKLISDMAHQEIGYTVAWALELDKDRRFWVNTGFPVKPADFGAVHIMIQRFADEVLILEGSLGTTTWHIDDSFAPGENHLPCRIVARLERITNE